MPSWLAFDPRRREGLMPGAGSRMKGQNYRMGDRPLEFYAWMKPRLGWRQKTTLVSLQNNGRGVMSLWHEYCPWGRHANYVGDRPYGRVVQKRTWRALLTRTTSLV